ncbi:MAG: hypothetical protein U0183_08595 [Polyangiaceae bacterium]
MNVEVSTLTLWVDDAVARLVLRAKEGQVSATEAATGDMAERALFAIATGRTAHAASVTAADVEATVTRLRKKFDAIGAKSPQPGIVDRAAVLGMGPDDLTPTERDFFLDLLEPVQKAMRGGNRMSKSARAAASHVANQLSSEFIGVSGPFSFHPPLQWPFRLGQTMKTSPRERRYFVPLRFSFHSRTTQFARLFARDLSLRSRCFPVNRPVGFPK